MARTDACRKPRPTILLAAVLAVSAVLMGRLDAGEVGAPAASAEPARAGGIEGAGERPGLLGPILEPINPARLQRLFDFAVGLDSGDVSRRPEAPEIGEPVFFDLTRPLGDRKYSNELNYLFNSSTANAPTLQVIEYEYTFADWHAAELDLLYYNGNLEVLTPFYQRTLGVGRRRNWVHGYQVSPDLYLRSGFVGGSAVYAFGWKPEAESRFSSLIFVGANRSLIGGFHPRPASLRSPGDKVYGSWRPLVSVDLFYKLGEKLSLGFENDLFFQSGRASEYFAFPFLTYEPSEHAFFQVGGGYYHFESRDQFTFMLHLNFVNASPRKAREEVRTRDEPEPEPEGATGRGRLRRRLDRLLGDR